MKNTKVLKIPRKKQWLFWSYDIDSLDLKKDKGYIITQVLNYGGWEDIHWLFRVYSRKEIMNVVRNPRRGLWFEDILNFWLQMFDIKLRKSIYQRATITFYKS